MIKKEFVFIAIVTFIVLLIWVATNIIHTRSSITITPNLQDALEPLDPNFDQKTLDQVSQIPSLSLTQTPQPTPTPTPTPIPPPTPPATQSATPSTASATLSP